MKDKTVCVWIVREIATGLYEAGEGFWAGKEGAKVWIPRCTAEDKDEACEYDDADFAESFPDGLPVGWERVKVMELKPKGSES